MGSTTYDWSPVFQAIQGLSSRLMYQKAIDAMTGGQTGVPQQPQQNPTALQTPPMTVNPGMIGGAQLPTQNIPSQPAPIPNAPLGGGPSPSPIPNATGSASPNPFASMLPMLKYMDPSMGMPLLMQLQMKQAERQQNIQDRAVKPLGDDEAKQLGLRPGGVYGRDISGNIVTIQPSDMHSKGAMDQELQQKIDEATKVPTTAYQNKALAIEQQNADTQRAALSKPVSVGFGDTLVNPTTGKPIYSGNMGGSTPPVDPKTGQPLSGDAFLNSVVPPQYRNQVKALGEYRQAPLTAMSLRSPIGAQLSTWVNQAYPGYDASQYGAKTKARADFVSGPDGRSLTAINTAVDHLGTLGQLAGALGNGNIQAVNALGQTWAQQTGSPAPTNFEAMKQIVGDEIVKALVGTGGSQSDRAAAAETISKASSPQQLAGAIHTYQQALAGKLGPLRQKYSYNTKLGDFNDMLTPTTSSVLGGLPQGDSKGGSHASAAPSDPLGIR